MSSPPPPPPPPLSLLLILTISLLPHLSLSAIDTFVYGGCTSLKYTRGSTFEANLNSLLASLVNSAMLSPYNNFTLKASTPGDTLYGIFQCQGNLDPSDCGRCVADSVSQLNGYCGNSCGAALQLQGCFVKYDNNSFIGVEDKTVIQKNCGPAAGYDSGELTRRDAMLAYLGSGGNSGTYRTASSGDIAGMAQCVGDLSPVQCQDCVSAAVARLSSDCGAAAWGEMFLGKCNARYSEGGDHSNSAKDYSDNSDTEKTLAIVFGLILGAGLIIVTVKILRKWWDNTGRDYCW